MPRLLTREGDVRKELEDVHNSLLANEAELPHLVVHRQAIGDVLQDIRGLRVDQDVFRAGKQQTSKRLSTALDKGRKLLTVVKVILRQHYGSGNEKLVEFGIQPFRGRPRPTVEATLAPEAPPEGPEDKPSEPTP